MPIVVLKWDECGYNTILYLASNIGYWIGKQYQGKGIATECIKLVVNYAFDVLELQEVSAYVFPDNSLSIRA